MLGPKSFLVGGLCGEEWLRGVLLGLEPGLDGLAHVGWQVHLMLSASTLPGARITPSVLGSLSETEGAFLVSWLCGGLSWRWLCLVTTQAWIVTHLWVLASVFLLLEKSTLSGRD